MLFSAGGTAPASFLVGGLTSTRSSTTSLQTLNPGSSFTLIYGPGVDLGEILGKDTIILNDINPNDFSLIHIV